ncbi:hypothetical protein M1N21_00300 [Dehalococcoidia bacterium]|nr:hypothetical protein [Dehalococcoidia bacterium]
MIGTILGAYGQRAVLQKVTTHLDEHGEVLSDSITETPITVHIWRQKDEQELEIPGLVSPGGFFVLIRPEVEVAIGDRLVIDSVRYKVVDKQSRRFQGGSTFYQVLGLSLEQAV